MSRHEKDKTPNRSTWGIKVAFQSPSRDPEPRRPLRRGFGRIWLEPAQQLAIPLESHPVEVPGDRGLSSEGSKAADYLVLEYFEGPQLLGLDIASDL